MNQGTRGADARLPELDALRGIAALLVLVHHAVQIVPRIENPDIPGFNLLRYTLTQLTPLRVIEFGRPAVLFFFVLSGYVLTRALLMAGSPGLAAFAAQRTIRLGLPVLVSVLFSLGLWALFADPNLPEFWRAHSLYTWLVPPDAMQVVTNVLLIATDQTMRLNVVLWSLVHEWRLTVLLPLVLLLRGRALLFAALALGAGWIGMMGGASEDSVVLGHHLRGSLAATLYFAPGIGAGVALALAFERDVPILRPDARIAAAAGCLALFSLSSDLAVYVGAALLIVLARQPGRFRAALRSPAALLAGRFSFSLYLVHVPVIVACMHVMHDRVPPLLMMAAAMTLALLAAFAFHPLVEEPARHLARRLERRLARRPGWRQPTPERRAPPTPPAQPDWAPEGGMPGLPR